MLALMVRYGHLNATLQHACAKPRDALGRRIGVYSRQCAPVTRVKSCKRRLAREVDVVVGLLSAKDIAAISYIGLVRRDDEGHRAIRHWI